MRGEAFRLHLDGYFTEQQQGRTLDLRFEYGYSGVLPRESMPDYRLVQLLVEEVLYVYPEEWVDVFWEMTNRELVRRLLTAFPQLAWVKCELSVVPSELLPIARSSIVEWHREDLPSLGMGTAEFSRPLADACYYASPPPIFNIGAPRYLLASLKGLYERLAAHTSNRSDDPWAGVVLSFIPACLAASSGTYAEMLSLCTEHRVYDALILPKRAEHGLERLGTVGELTGLVEVAHKEPTPTKANDANEGVAEHLLHSLLGAPPGWAAASHSSARSGFITGRYSRMVLEGRFAQPLTLRGYEATPAFEGEPLELCAHPDAATCAGRDPLQAKVRFERAVHTVVRLHAASMQGREGADAAAGASPAPPSGLKRKVGESEWD